MQNLKARCFTCALFGHALSASVLLVLSPLGGDVIDVGLLIELGHISGFG